MKTAIIECITVDEKDPKNLDTFLLVDLSLFNIINSSVIGVLGSVLMNPNIRLLGLCGVQPPVEDMLVRFGLLSKADSRGCGFVMPEVLKNNIEKVVTFDTIEQGLSCLNPT